MAMYTEQEAYKYLERIAIALEKITGCMQESVEQSAARAVQTAVERVAESRQPIIGSASASRAQQPAQAAPKATPVPLVSSKES